MHSSYKTQINFANEVKENSSNVLLLLGYNTIIELELKLIN